MSSRLVMLGIMKSELNESTAERVHLKVLTEYVKRLSSGIHKCVLSFATLVIGYLAHYHRPPFQPSKSNMWFGMDSPCVLSTN